MANETPTFSQNKINQVISRGRRALKIPRRKRTASDREDVRAFGELGEPAMKEIRKSLKPPKPR